jgi:hypothetical protein
MGERSRAFPRLGADASSQWPKVFAKRYETDEVMRRKKASFGRREERELFIMLPRALLVDPVWVSLPATARVIFLDMCKIHRHAGGRGSGNNGQIGYGCAAGTRAANISTATAHRMLLQIRNSGLVKLRKEGSFKVKAGEGRTREWEITIYPVDGRPAISWGESKLHIKQYLLENAAYRDLSSSAKCILIELMRRYDGGNNEDISFGGPGGAYAGFSNDVTERALTELQRAGFIVQTAPAVPHLSRPRNWRLTMYAADGKSATNDFMRNPRRTALQKSYRGFTSAVDSAQNVSMMRVATSSNLSAPSKMAAFREENVIYTKRLGKRAPILDSRAGETFDPAHTRTNEIHLEASPPASLEAGFAAAKLSVRTKCSTELIVEWPAGLFGDALPSMATRLDQLRVELRGVLARKRGTQSRLAEALGLSRQTFANALSGRERFTGTAVAALRRWIDGNPLSRDWPPLPPAMEELDAV